MIRWNSRGWLSGIWARLRLEGRAADSDGLLVHDDAAIPAGKITDLDQSAASDGGPAGSAVRAVAGVPACARSQSWRQVVAGFIPDGTAFADDTVGCLRRASSIEA